MELFSKEDKKHFVREQPVPCPYPYDPDVFERFYHHQLDDYQKKFDYWKRKLSSLQKTVNTLKKKMTCVYKQSYDYGLFGELKKPLRMELYYYQNYYNACIEKFRVARSSLVTATRYMNKYLDGKYKELKETLPKYRWDIYYIDVEHNITRLEQSVLSDIETDKELFKGLNHLIEDQNVPQYIRDDIRFTIRRMDKIRLEKSLTRIPKDSCFVVIK